MLVSYSFIQNRIFIIPFSLRRQQRMTADVVDKLFLMMFGGLCASAEPPDNPIRTLPAVLLLANCTKPDSTSQIVSQL